jgi:hypothetical protein
MKQVSPYTHILITVFDLGASLHPRKAAKLEGFTSGPFVNTSILKCLADADRGRVAVSTDGKVYAEVDVTLLRESEAEAEAGGR